jgi:hypothetical protein
MIPEFERAKTVHALNRAATVVGILVSYNVENVLTINFPRRTLLYAGSHINKIIKFYYLSLLVLFDDTVTDLINALPGNSSVNTVRC